LSYERRKDRRRRHHYVANLPIYVHSRRRIIEIRRGGHSGRFNVAHNMKRRFTGRNCRGIQEFLMAVAEINAIATT